jgi:hypothetical protein
MIRSTSGGTRRQGWAPSVNRWIEPHVPERVLTDSSYAATVRRLIPKTVKAFPILDLMYADAC